ncbi:MAG: TetR/AcrR family transcriptional regulator [Desulfobacterales bacterium]
MEPKKKRMTGDERRRKIIQAAMYVFSRSGFSGATTRKIAKKAGISEAMIYSHFKDKEDLYSAIIDQKMQESEPLYYPLDAMRKKDDERVFETIVSNFMQRYSEDTTFLRLLLFSALEGHELAGMFVGGPVRRFFEFLAEYMRERIDEEAFKPINPEIASRCLVGMVHYFVLLKKIYGDETLQSIELDETIETMINIFCRGILKEGQNGSA